MAPFWDIRFSSKAKIAKQVLSFEVYLQNGSFAVLLLDAIPNINVSALFNYFFEPATWPSQVFDLSLTNSEIFYNNTAAGPLPAGLPDDVLAILQNQTAPGLFATSTVTLTLAGTTFDDITVTIEFDTGNKQLTVEGTWDSEVDLLPDFISLGGPPIFDSTGNVTGFGTGPSLTVSSSGTFSLNCSYTFFNHPFGYSELQVMEGPPRSFTAKLGFDGDIGPFTNTNLHLTLTWIDGKGFSVTDFPALPFQGVINDIEDLLDKVSKASGCGGLANLAGQAISGDCNVTTQVTTTQPPGADPGQVWIVIGGWFNVMAAGTQIVTVPLPQLVLSFSISVPGSSNDPPQFSFDSIGTAIENCLLQNAQQIVQELYDDKAQLAAVIAVIAGEQALRAAASEAAQAACDELKDALEEFADDFADALADYLGADGVADLAALLAAAAAVLDLFGGAGGGSSPLPPLTSPAVSAQYSAGTIVVSFGAVTNATGYKVLATSSTGALIGNPALSAGTLTTTLPVDPKLPAGACSIRVKALGDSITRSNSLYSVATISKLAAPTSVTVAYDPAADQVTAGWGAVTSAAAYAVTITRAADNAIVVTATTNALSQTLSSITLAPLGTQDYSVAVQAMAGAAAIPSSSTAAGTTLSRLPAPASVGQSVLVPPSGLRVVWPPVPGASGFVLSVTAQSTPPAVALNERIPVPAPQANGTLQHDLLFTNFTVRSSGRYQVSVVALGDSTHLNSVSSPAATNDLLFSGIGFGQVGTTFTVG